MVIYVEGPPRAKKSRYVELYGSDVFNHSEIVKGLVVGNDGILIVVLVED